MLRKSPLLGASFFHLSDRYAPLSAAIDQLGRLTAVVDFEADRGQSIAALRFNVYKTDDRATNVTVIVCYQLPK